MKKMLNIRGLKEYCECNKPHKILFQTENQPWYRAADPCKIKMSFQIMLIYENPNLICLKSGDNTICLDRVKFVEIDTDCTVLGTLITVFCGEFGSSGYDITYKLIVAEQVLLPI